MKNQVLLLLIILTPLFIIAQNTWTVNPDPNSAAHFNTLAEAIDGAAAGDILLLHHGSYQADTLDKQLTIYGPGYFLSENPETQTNSLSAAISGNFRVLSGGDNSIISGVEFMSTIYIVDISNLLLDRCKGSAVSINNSSFITVSKSYLTGSIFPASNTNNGNITINNSVLSTAGSNSSFLSCTVTNCILTATTNSRNTSYKNNIFLNTSYGINLSASYNNAASNNIFVGTPSGANGTNQISVNATTLFVDAATSSTDGQYQLASGSPAIGAGEGGTDCGIFGGSDPYILSGIPRIPHIYEISIPNTASTTEGLEIQIKAKVGNQ